MQNNTMDPNLGHGGENIGSTTISNNTVIEGSIMSKENLKIAGMVRGNVVSERSVTITGQIDGDVEANDINFVKGVVNGNITAKAEILASSETVIVGDVIGESLETDGKIKGAITVRKGIVLKNNSVIVGNITAKSIAIQEGASINSFLDVEQNDVTDRGYTQSENLFKQDIDVESDSIVQNAEMEQEEEEE